MKNRAPLQSLAIALLTAALVVSLTIADGHAAKIRKNTEKSKLPPGELTDMRSATRPSGRTRSWASSPSW